MTQLIMVILSAFLCLSNSGCATIKESRGDLLEDVGKLIFDIQTGLTDFGNKTFAVKDPEHLKEGFNNGSKWVRNGQKTNE